MTHLEKASLCELLASLFSPPDHEVERLTQEGSLYSFFKKYTERWGEGEQLLKGFLVENNSENLGEELKASYEQLFSDLQEDPISLVESFYKPWTEDPQCTLMFATQKGLLFGDCALHLSAIYKESGLEIPEEFKWRPDHLSLELEFLSLLYRFKTDREVKTFIEQHLDWIVSLKKEFGRFQPHPFYVSAIAFLDLFLRRERERLEAEEYGSKDND